VIVTVFSCVLIMLLQKKVLGWHATWAWSKSMQHMKTAYGGLHIDSAGFVEPIYSGAMQGVEVFPVPGLPELSQQINHALEVSVVERVDHLPDRVARKI
jgi:hypothetical protein